MKQTLDSVWMNARNIDEVSSSVKFRMVSECYRPLIRYNRYAVRLAAKLEDICLDPQHQRLMDDACNRGSNIYPMSLIRGDVEVLQNIIGKVGLVEPALFQNNNAFRIPLRHIFALFTIMDASQIMTDKMMYVSRNTDYLNVFREAKQKGISYNGPSTLTEFITLRWSVPYIERNLKTHIQFDRTDSSWVKSVEKVMPHNRQT